MTWVGKLLSGTAPALSVSGGATITRSRAITETEFVTLQSIIYVDSARSFITPYLVATAACDVRMAGWSIIQFDTEQNAINYVNSSVFTS